MAIRLHLFGPPRVAQGGEPVALVFERRSQLLVYLALRSSWVARGELAELLWPRMPVEQAQANLRKTLFRLRSLQWAPAVAVRDASLSFDGTTDVADFEAAVAEHRWADAVQIAGAALLDGFEDDASTPWLAWLRAERARLYGAWRTAALQHLATPIDPAQALTLSSRLLAQDPLDEPALRAHMLAHAQQGQPQRARDAYRAYAARLADKSGGVPSTALQAVLDTLATPPADLPTQPSTTGEPGIIGRAAEQRAIRARLQEGCRLLCLIGPGGVGKSCLARHMLSQLAPRYADGALYIPLEDVPSPDALGVRLARDLAVRLDGGHDPLQAVIAFLRERRMLLALDNFEHLQAAAPQLQALLDACPQVQVLATSRVRLGLGAEQLLPLDGLPCPEPEDGDCLEAFDAARLFVRAARAVAPALQPATEATAIADICRLVDGLPLALEMAGAWTRVLSCSEIAAELRHNLELLTESDTARPARHASMAAVFEQSWQRLKAAERSTWARLTVFHGGFTLEAARAVAGATPPVLAALIDQSLLRKTGTRTDLHPLLRQLAAGRLADEERDASCSAHAAHYLRWIVPLRSSLQHGDKQTLRQIDTEFENLRAAWRWACDHRMAGALQPAVLPLMAYCDLRGRHQEGLMLMRAASAGFDADDVRVRPLLDAAMAYLEMRLDHHADARALAERALRASRATRDHATRLQSFKALGGCALELGQLPRARRRYRQALALAPAAVDARNAASMLMNLAIVEKKLGCFEAAHALYMQSLVEQRRLQDAAGEAVCLNNLAALEMDTDRIDAAAAHFEASLTLCERHALTSTMMVVLESLTDLSVRRHDAAAVRRYGQRAYELASQMGARGILSRLQLHYAQLALQQRNLPAARDALRAAAEDAIVVDHAPLQLDCVLCLANLLSAQGEPTAAIRPLRYAIDHPATANTARDRARGRLAEWSSVQAETSSISAPTVDLKTLMLRIVSETPAAHAGLIEDLRGT